MAQVTAVYEEATDYWATWSHIFGGQNTTWLNFDQRVFLGNFFLGLQAQGAVSWNTQIPPGSTILSATMEMTPFSSNFNPSYTTTMNSADRSLQQQKQDPIQKPFEPFLGYRKDQWSNAQTGALSTTFTAVYGTSVTSNAFWRIRQTVVPGGTVPTRAHVAQKITTRTGNMTIASLFWELSRTGSPAGSCRVRIQGLTNDRGIDIPDGVDIAVSNDRLCSSIATSATLEIFTFPVNPTLVALTDYFIIFEADYTADNLNYLYIHHENTFLSNGQLFHYGEGLGHDWQNYPGQVDLNQALCDVVNLVATDTIWPIDLVTNGVTEVSPDISALVQAQIDMPNYTIDSGIIINLTRFVPTSQNRIMRSNDHVPGPGPVLRITYEEPVPGSESETHDRFNDLPSDYLMQARREDDEL
ncbi:MAG: hypothetical protein E4H01_00765 [Lysobacterales bacterium]|nr:MAG: hypothetical protein E4H01_00765 [Xanthomonadales bacterium]